VQATAKALTQHRGSGAVARSYYTGPVRPRDRQGAEPFTTRQGLPFLPDAPDRLAILQHVVVGEMGIDRRADLGWTQRQHADGVSGSPDQEQLPQPEPAGAISGTDRTSERLSRHHFWLGRFVTDKVHMISPAKPAGLYVAIEWANGWEHRPSGLNRFRLHHRRISFSASRTVTTCPFPSSPSGWPL
jgi:hypothetical protein